jgi:hypothetical protein
MSSIIPHLLESLSLGAPQSFRNMGVIPLMSVIKSVIDYIPFGEALAAKMVQVTELTQTGCVSELKVRNTSDKAVLALDGEELEGAKQNRVLNTTILLKMQSEIVIPVSCTEQGRWSYNAPEFKDSGNVLFREARASKISAVSDSLAYSSRFESNQGEIWNSIHELHRKAGTQSSTGAMKDFYNSSHASFEDYLKAFPCLEGQRGLLVFLDGRVAGFDFISRDGAYKALHVKLLKSYAVESLLAAKAEEHPVSAEKAQEFLEKAKEARENRFKSLGHGWDHRYSSPAVVGSALAYRRQVVHAAFFAVGNGKDYSPMSSLRKRAGFRNQEI